MDADYNSGNLDRLSDIALSDAIIGPMRIPFSKGVEEMRTELRKGSRLTVHSVIKDVVLQGDHAVVSVSRTGEKPMGAFLHEHFGEGMYVVGFAFDRGEVRAVGVNGNEPTKLGIHKASPSPPGSGDDILNSTGMPMFFLDMAHIPTATALSKWLGEPHLFHQAGSTWNDSDADANYQLETLSKEYDGLIYIAESHSTVGIGFAGH